GSLEREVGSQFTLNAQRVMHRVRVLQLRVHHLIHARKTFFFNLPLDDYAEIVVIHGIFQTIFQGVLTAEHHAARRIGSVHAVPKRRNHLRAEEKAGAASDYGLAASVDGIRKSQTGSEVYGIAFIRIVSGPNGSDGHIADVDAVGVDQD